MKSIYLIGCIIVLLLNSCSKKVISDKTKVRSASLETVYELSDRSKTGLLSYLEKVIQNRWVIIGQQCSETSNLANDYQKNFQRLFDSTGKYPALLGLDYGYFANIDVDNVNEFALSHWNKGGLVTISWHADNPFIDGYNVRWNSITNKDAINPGKLLKGAGESKEKSSYRNELNKVATALQQLQKAGVLVLWRPFHEVNGDWFWWCANDVKQPTNQPDYTALWQDMYETFTKDFGLNNLLWVYSPNTAGNGFPSVATMYPGDKYVDIIATDIYSKQPVFADYNDLKNMNKLIVNGEVGPSKEAYGSFNEQEVLDTFKGKAAYFLQWHSWINAKVAIVDNINYKEMMNDPAAITLDKIKLRNW